MPKRSLREKLLAARRHCSAETCLHLSLLVQERFLAGETYRRANAVGLYSPVLNEVHTELVARRCLAEGKRLVYPRVRGALLEFVEVGALDELAPGAFGVGEPTGGGVMILDDLDVLVVPGVAFDDDGFRLGYGKGYYDRALAGCAARLERVGFAYEFQVVAELPADHHDCRLTQLVTEQRLLRFPAELPAGRHIIPRRGGAEC
jgi:5-formyltetrahydrofolate cyclo-ligase